MIPLSTIPANSTLYCYFSSYGKTNGESITLTGLAVTDIEIYKNGSTTQRASDAGYTLLDTDGIDFDGITGIHGFSIDLSDNTDAGFYAVGSQYVVIVSTVTIDSQTVSFIADRFRIVAAEGVTGKPKVDVDAFGGTAGTFSGGRPEVNTSHIAGSAVSTSSAQIGVNVVNAGGTAWGSGAITAASIAADAITAAKVADGTIDAATFAAGAITATVIATGAIDADALAADAAAEIADAVWDEAAAGHVTAGTFGEQCGTDIDAILVDTGTTLDGRIPAALTAGGNMKADVLAISGSTAAADNLEESTEAIAYGTIGTGSTTTSLVASSFTPASAVNDQFNGRTLIFKNDTTTAALRGQATTISDYDHASLTLTVAALTSSAVSGDTFAIL